MQTVIEVLWSDPCPNDSIDGHQLNPERDPSNSGKMVKFGKNLVDEFLYNCDADYILRAHECVENGF